MAKGGTGAQRGRQGRREQEHRPYHSVHDVDDLDIGSDTRTVDDADSGRSVTGTINKLTFKLGPEQLTAADRKAAQDMKNNADK
jgi:hypothetical protein